jgi:hypothetical protein
MHYSTIGHQKDKDSNPRPCTTPLTPKKAKIRTHDHALHHHWPPKVKDSNPIKKTKIRTQDHALPGMHYTTIDHEGRNILSVDIMICARALYTLNTLPGSHNAISIAVIRFKPQLSNSR